MRRGAILLLTLPLLAATPAAAENLGQIFGPRFSTDTHGGLHFDDRLSGGSWEAELGVHALRHRQDLQERDLRLREPYALRHRDAADRRGRAPWPNGEWHLRGGPSYRGEQASCHPVSKRGLDAAGAPAGFTATRCYDDYGEPYVLEGSRRRR